MEVLKRMKSVMQMHIDIWIKKEGDYENRENI